MKCQSEQAQLAARPHAIPDVNEWRGQNRPRGENPDAPALLYDEQPAAPVPIVTPEST